MNELIKETKNAYDYMNKEELKKASDFCEGYKDFLNKGKLERYVVSNAVETAKSKGFKEFEYNKKYSAGDKIYMVQKNKAAIFAIIGEEPIEEGFKIIAAHADCPRIDIKGNPLYEDSQMALFKTHYYGGIRKYQWVALPLTLCGVVYKNDGSMIDINIGDNENDPVFCITDLLPHLGKEQGKKPLDTAYSGEDLNALTGSEFISEGEKKDGEKIKKNVLKILNEKYGITEHDFISADLSLVPAGKARDLGIDRSMILAFGQDDRICVYPSFMALIEKNRVKNTSVCIIADREEVGSMGVTGLRSSYMTDFLEELCITSGQNPRKAFKNSMALSADVMPAFDPNFPEVFDKRNSAFINCGAAFSKFTGVAGKSGSSEAAAEYISKIRRELDNKGILYQFAELGKVDQGGGGTVSQFIADRNIEVVDIGVPILSMHAPYEAAAKNDIYMLYKVCETFFE